MEQASREAPRPSPEAVQLLTIRSGRLQRIGRCGAFIIALPPAWMDSSPGRMARSTGSSTILPSTSGRSIRGSIQCSLGRRTYELTRQPGAPAWPRGWRIYVFSRTLSRADAPDVTLMSTDVAAVVKSLREESGRDIWLFGGGSLFAALLNENLVDRLSVAVMPVLLGGGTPLVGPRADKCHLTLSRSDVSASGICVIFNTTFNRAHEGSGSRGRAHDTLPKRVGSTRRSGRTWTCIGTSPRPSSSGASRGSRHL